MPTTPRPDPARTADRIAAASAVLHLGVAALGAWLARRDEPTAYWILTGVALLGLVATLLVWSSVRGEPNARTAGLVVVGLSVSFLVWGVALGGLGVLACAAPLLLLDGLLLLQARRAVS